MARCNTRGLHELIRAILAKVLRYSIPLLFVAASAMVAYLADASLQTRLDAQNDPSLYPQYTDSRKEPLETLIKRLDSDDFNERYKATRELLRRDGVALALRRAVVGAQTEESRCRLQRILGQLEVRDTERHLQKLLRRIENGQVDEFVDQMAYLENKLDDRVWNALGNLAEKLAGKSKHTERIRALLRLSRMGMPHEFAKNLYTNRTSSTIANKSIIVATAPIQVDRIFCDHVLFSNADLECRTLASCIVVCDGNVRSDTTGMFSTVVARGTVSRPNTFCLVVDNAQQALEMVKFYDTRQAGAEVSFTNGKIIVAEVLPHSPCARAGLQRGDEILSVDNAEISSKQAFRALLRKCAVTTENAALKIRRPNTGIVNLQVQFGNQ